MINPSDVCDNIISNSVLNKAKVKRKRITITLCYVIAIPLAILFLFLKRRCVSYACDMNRIILVIWRFMPLGLVNISMQ